MPSNFGILEAIEMFASHTMVHYTSDEEEIRVDVWLGCHT